MYTNNFHSYFNPSQKEVKTNEQEARKSFVARLLDKMGRNTYLSSADHLTSGRKKWLLNTFPRKITLGKILKSGDWEPLAFAFR